MSAAASKRARRRAATGCEALHPMRSPHRASAPVTPCRSRPWPTAQTVSAGRRLQLSPRQLLLAGVDVMTVVVKTVGAPPPEPSLPITPACRGHHPDPYPTCRAPHQQPVAPTRRCAPPRGATCPRLLPRYRGAHHAHDERRDWGAQHGEAEGGGELLGDAPPGRQHEVGLGDDAGRDQEVGDVGGDFAVPPQAFERIIDRSPASQGDVTST